MLTWEFNINLGTILPLIFAAGVFYAITKTDMKALKDNVVEIKAALAKQTETIAQIAVQNTRLDNQDRLIAASQAQQTLLERRLFNLSQGKGWVKEKLDGEY